MRAPEAFDTRRLTLRRPAPADAREIFARYASDPAVTRYLGWSTHRTLEDTSAFLAFSEAEWARWPAGPYLVFLKADGTLIGSTGLAFETDFRAATGYVLARNAWGQGYATESLTAMCDVAAATGVRRLYALCHPDHRASWRVLEKCGFEREGTWRRHAVFPNLLPESPGDVLCYSRVW